MSQISYNFSSWTTLFVSCGRVRLLPGSLRFRLNFEDVDALSIGCGDRLFAAGVWRVAVPRRRFVRQLVWAGSQTHTPVQII